MLADARKAFLDNRIGVTDQIHIGGKKTTLGTESIDSHLPGDLTLDKLTKKGVVEEGFGALGLDKKTIGAILSHVAKTTPDAYGKTANALRRLGSEKATWTGDNPSHGGL